VSQAMQGERDRLRGDEVPVDRLIYETIADIAETLIDGL